VLFRSVTSCILDCEVVAIDPSNNKILPFQVLSTRARKDVAISEIKVAICLYGFDLLYLNGRSLLQETLRVRRQLLRSHLFEVPGKFYFATSLETGDTSEIETFLHQAVAGQCEGLMVKTLDANATYQPSRRTFNWLKLKKDYLEGLTDSFDLVPIGGWFGKGKRTGVYGAYLLACYNPDEESYEAICKIGTGFSDVKLEELTKALQAKAVTGPRGYYKYNEADAPDVWFDPAQVWEVHAADLSISPVHQAAIGMVPHQALAKGVTDTVMSLGGSSEGYCIAIPAVYSNSGRQESRGRHQLGTGG